MLQLKIISFSLLLKQDIATNQVLLQKNILNFMKQEVNLLEQ